MDLTVAGNELRQKLQADAARRPAVDGRNGDFLDVGSAFGDHTHSSGTLGTDATTVADVLDIAADMNGSKIIAERRADSIARIGRIRPSANVLCGFNQRHGADCTPSVRTLG